VPIIRRKLLYLFDTGICQSVWVASGLLVGLKIQPAEQTPPIQNDKYQCRIDTVIFSWWRVRGFPKHVQKKNKYIKQNCAPSWIYLRRVRCLLLENLTDMRKRKFCQRNSQIVTMLSFWSSYIHFTQI